MRKVLAFVAVMALVWSLPAYAAFDPQTEEYIDACALGKIPLCKHEIKFAHRDSVPTTEVPLWHGDTTYAFVDTGESVDVVSTDTNDTIAGTGAQKVMVVGLLAGEWVSEEVSMNGTTDVPTTQFFDYIHRMYVSQAGAAAPNNAAIDGSNGAAGNITATTGTGGDMLAFVEANDNITHQMILRVPTNEQWLLHRAVISVGFGQEVIVSMSVRVPNTNIFLVKNELTIAEGSPVISEHTLFAPGTDVIFTARSAVSTVEVGMYIQILRLGLHGVVPETLP